VNDLRRPSTLGPVPRSALHRLERSRLVVIILLPMANPNCRAGLSDSAFPTVHTIADNRPATPLGPDRLSSIVQAPTSVPPPDGQT